MENLSRTEELLDVLLNGTELPETKPQSRIEEKLHALCEKGLGGGGGSSDYSDLKNKPTINGVELSGNKTNSDLGITNPTDEQVISAVNAWLRENPDATTTIMDKSINPDKTTWLRQIYHNIFDASTITDGRFFYSNSSDDTTGGGTANYFVSDYIPVEGGKKYLFGMRMIAVRWVDENKTFIPNTAVSTAAVDTILVAPDTARYVRFSVSKDITTPDTMRVHEYIGESYDYDTYKNLYEIRISDDSFVASIDALMKQEVENGNVDIGELISLENIPFEKINGFEEWRWNIVNPKEVVMGSLDDSGNDRPMVDSDTTIYRRTGYISVTPGEQLHTICASTYGYDIEKNFVSAVDDTNGIITIPENVYFIRQIKVSSNGVIPVFNIFRRNYGQNSLVYNSDIPYSSYFPMFKDEIAKNGFKSYLGIYPWADKKFCFIGDSFTAPGIWNRNMVDVLQGIFLGSKAISGGSFADRDGVPKTAYEQAQEFVTDGWNPDVILITLGTNDVNHVDLLGEIVNSYNISDFDLGTYTGGMQACLNYLQNNFPNAIIYMGWTPMGGLNLFDNNDFITRMKEVALLYGIEYIETRTCGVTTLSAVYADCYESGVNGGHPTRVGQAKIAEYMTRLMSNKR